MRLAITFKFTHSFKSDNAQKSLLFMRALGSLRFMKPFLFLDKSRIEGLSAFFKPLVVGLTIFDLLVISDGFVFVGRFTGFTFTTSAERSVGFQGGRSFTHPFPSVGRLFVILRGMFPLVGLLDFKSFSYPVFIR